MGQHLNAINKLITKGIKQVRLVCEPLALHIIARRSKANKWRATQNDESQDRLARKCNKLHEVIWKIELFIVYAREN
jgi:hypothetical protein